MGVWRVQKQHSLHLLQRLGREILFKPGNQQMSVSGNRLDLEGCRRHLLGSFLRPVFGLLGVRLVYIIV